MGKTEFEALKVSQLLQTEKTPGGGERLRCVIFKTNLHPGDVIERLIFFEGNLAGTEYYEVTGQSGRFINVQWKAGDKIRIGVFSCRQMMGELSPAPRNQVEIHYRLIKKRG